MKIKDLFSIAVIRYTFIASVAIVTFYLIANFCWTYPSVTNLVVNNTVDEATRVGEFFKDEALGEDGKLLAPLILKIKAEYL